MNANQLKAIHVAVLALFTAYNGMAKADGIEYKAMANVLKTAPLNDADYVKALRDDMLTTFGEAHKDAAQKRINVLNNARRVAYGGTKDGKAIRGKGHAAMLEVVNSVSTFRDLRTALSDAVPATLKGASGGDRKTGKGKKGAKANPLSVPKVATREEAYAAARKVLEFCRDKFTKPSETGITEAIDKCIAVLQ